MFLHFTVTGLSISIQSQVLYLACEKLSKEKLLFLCWQLMQLYTGFPWESQALQKYKLIKYELVNTVLCRRMGKWEEFKQYPGAFHIHC